MISKEQVEENVKNGWAILKDSPNHRITISGKLQTIVGRGGLPLSDWRDMSTYIDNNGYEHTAYRVNNVKVHAKIHRLMAIYFIYNHGNNPQVNHISGVKTDNRLSNLEWCTALHNSRHAIENGLKRIDGSLCKQAKLNEDNVLLIKSMLNNGKKEKEIAGKFGVTRATISKIKHGRSWKHVA